MITKISPMFVKFNFNSNSISQISFKSNLIKSECDAFVKSNDDKTSEDKKRKLASFGLSDKQCLKYLSYSPAQIDKIIKAFEVGAEPNEIDEVLKLSQKQFNRYLEIRQETSDDFRIVCFDDERYNRALDLLKKGINNYDIHDLSLISNEKFEHISNFLGEYGDELAPYLLNNLYLKRALQMQTLGVKPRDFSTLIDYNDKTFDRALNIYNYSSDINLINSFLFGMSDELFSEAQKLLDEGLNPHLVPSILYSPQIKAKYTELSENYDKKTASILAGITDDFYLIADGASKNSLAELINHVDLNPKLACEDLGKKFYSLCMANINFEDLNKYIRQFDLEKLSKLAPSIKNYSPEDLLDFYVYHFKKSDNILDKNTLKNLNFEVYLSNNLTTPAELTKSLIKFPLAKRQIGEIPNDWLENIPNEKKDKLQDEIDKTILSFNKTKDENEFCKTMSEILNKNVKISRLPAGAFGKCYRIKIEGVQDTCLKLFKTIGANIDNGASYEPQAALFANNNSNNFVKMFFARIAPMGEKDAYIVTQYLDETIKPIETKTASGFDVYSIDASQDCNMINGKIIDFGALEIIDEKSDDM